jgi:hypothetical protein
MRPWSPAADKADKTRSDTSVGTALALVLANLAVVLIQALAVMVLASPPLLVILWLVR